MRRELRVVLFVICFGSFALLFAGCAKIADQLAEGVRPEKYDIVFFFSKDISKQFQNEFLETKLSASREDGAGYTSEAIESMVAVDFRGHDGMAIHFRKTATPEQRNKITWELATSEIVFRVYTNAAIQDFEQLWKIKPIE